MHAFPDSVQIDFFRLGGDVPQSRLDPLRCRQVIAIGTQRQNAKSIVNGADSRTLGFVEVPDFTLLAISGDAASTVGCESGLVPAGGRVHACRSGLGIAERPPADLFSVRQHEAVVVGHRDGPDRRFVLECCTQSLNTKVSSWLIV